MQTVIPRDNAAWAAMLAQSLTPETGRDVVLSPGSRSTPLLLAFAATAGARLHVIVDERAAAFFALGLARASGQAVVLLCTSGSAGAHYLPALTEASQSGVALLVLTADRPAELHHCGAPQTLPQTHLFGTHVRWFADVGAPHPDISPRWLRRLCAQALDHAEGERPGPVHLNIPLREPFWAADADAPAVRYTGLNGPPARVVRGPPTLASAQVDALTARVGQARRGLIVCGPRAPGIDNPLLAAAVTALAQQLGWPVLTEPTSQLRCGAPTGSPIVSHYDALLRDHAFAQAAAPELVLRIGRAPTSKVLNLWLGQYAQDRTILIDPAGGWYDHTQAADTLLVAEPAALLRALLAALPSRRPHGSWQRTWLAADQVAAAVLTQAAEQGFWEGSVAHTVVTSLPAGAALHVASSMPIRDIDTFTPALAHPLTFFCNRGVNGIDGTLATALGAAHNRQAPTAVLLGDVAFLHDLGALHLAQQLSTRLTAVVVNNNGGGIFRFLPVAEATPHLLERYYLTPQQADIGALAQASGAHHTRVTSNLELQRALETSWSRPGLQVIEAMVPGDNNVALHKAAWQAVASALHLQDWQALAGETQ